MRNLKSNNEVGNHIQVGLNLANGITTGDPHGDANVQNAGIIALYESWAEHIGMTYADRTYGIHTWFNTSTSLYHTYIQWLEHQRNESQNHIPIGIYYDLQDGINSTEIAGDGLWGQTDNGIINDNISGLSNGQLFSLFNSTVNTPLAFRNALVNSGFVTGNTATQNINDLFNSY